MFADLVQGGYEVTEETGIQRTLHTTYAYLEQAIFNLRGLLADAIIDTFPIYQPLTTTVNLQARFERKRREIKGEEPDLNNECSDDLEKETPEQIDNFVDKLGEWYREYHAWCLEELAKARSEKPQEDTCAPPAVVRGRESLEIAKQLLGEMKEDDAEWPPAGGGGRAVGEAAEELQTRLTEELRRVPED